MMDSDASRHELRQQLNLWQVTVSLVQPLKLLLDEFLYKAFGVAICKVDLGVKFLGVLGRACPAERKHN